MENLNVLNQKIEESVNTCVFTTGLNLGNLLVKVKGDNGRDMFKSSAVAITEDDVLDLELALSANGDKNVIKVNGNLYRISRADCLPGSIQERPVELMRAIIAYAIARQLKLKKGNPYKKFDICEVVACLGLPICEFKKKENRVYLKKQFSGTYDIEYLGLKIKLVLNKKNMKLAAEGYVYFELNFNKLKNVKRLYLVDLGSRTCDVAFVDEGTPTDPDSIVNSGVLKLMEMLKKHLPTGITERELEEMIRTGETDFMNNSYYLSDYNDVIDKYVTFLVTAIKKKYTEIDIAQKIIVFGGGAYILKDRFKKHFSSKIDIEFLDDAEYVNADAYYLYAQQ